MSRIVTCIAVLSIVLSHRVVLGQDESGRAHSVDAQFFKKWSDIPGKLQELHQIISPDATYGFGDFAARHRAAVLVACFGEFNEAV